MDKNDLKEATKQAIKEWLDERFNQFGRWTFNALAAAVGAAMLYFVLKMNGWNHS